MPLYNQVGEPMPRLVLPARQVRLNYWLESLSYPRDEKVIFRLSPKVFKTWLYLQDPKKALLMMSTYSIPKRVNDQLTPSLWKLVCDFIWRVFH